MAVPARTDVFGSIRTAAVLHNGNGQRRNRAPVLHNGNGQTREAMAVLHNGNGQSREAMDVLHNGNEISGRHNSLRGPRTT